MFEQEKYQDRWIEVIQSTIIPCSSVANVFFQVLIISQRHAEIHKPKQVVKFYFAIRENICPFLYPFPIGIDFPLTSISVFV